MALNPALRKMIDDAKAKYASPDTALRAKFPVRDFLLKTIENRLECLHATPKEHDVDYAREALDILQEIEMWAESLHPNGYLIFANPADYVEELSDKN